MYDQTMGVFILLVWKDNCFGVVLTVFCVYIYTHVKDSYNLAQSLLFVVSKSEPHVR